MQLVELMIRFLMIAIVGAALALGIERLVVHGVSGDRQAAVPEEPPSCAQPRADYNAGGECFDTPPSPRAAPLLEVPPEVDGIPRPTTLWVQIDDTGRAVRVVVAEPSNSGAFTAAATEFATALGYDPAVKDGRAVRAWHRVTVMPRARSPGDTAREAVPR